jgi:hypothetical protein
MLCICKIGLDEPPGLVVLNALKGRIASRQTIRITGRETGLDVIGWGERTYMPNEGLHMKGDS